MTGQIGRSSGWNRQARALLMATLLATLLALPATAFAAPTTVLFEGFLRNAVGGPAADGKYQVSFALYDSDKAVQDFWQVGPVAVDVTSGQFSWVLGSTKAMESAMWAAKGTAWLQIKVGNDPALPRQKLHDVPFAAYAVAAGGLSCTNCVPLSSLKIDGDLDVGGNSLKASNVAAAKIQAGAINAETVVAGTVSAQKFVGDGSGLTGVGIDAANCPGGKVVSGIDQAGKLICISTSGALPPDGLKVVSNGVLSNDFIDKVTSPKVPVAIPDNNPVGVADTIEVPDLGQAQDLTISVNITNSKMNQLEVTIYDPNNDKYVLWNKGQAGTKLVAVYPKPNATVSGDLTVWYGKNPAGKWRIHVIDHEPLAGSPDSDGAINSWSIDLHTLSNKKVQVKGDLVLTGKIIGAGGGAGGGAEVLLGSSNGACNADNKGLLRYHNDALEFCNGSTWRRVDDGGATYRWAVWTPHSAAHSWFGSNKTDFFGGVAPSNWTSNYVATHISDKADLLRALYVRRGPRIGLLSNATVYADEWRHYNSSSGSKFVSALFRVRNTTKGEITWNVTWYRTAYGGWGDRASIAINGGNVWDSGGSNYSPSTSSNHAIKVPASRTSTVIFIAAATSENTSSYGGGTRSLFMAFTGGTLKLPNGLEYVDDLHTKADGWNN